MDTSLITLANQLTLAAAALIACYFLWRAYNAAVSEHIKDLREFNRDQLYEVKSRIMALEDKVGIQRAERFKYQLPMRDEEKEVALNLDN